MPDFAAIFGVVLAGMSAVAVWFFRLWRGAKEREAESERRRVAAEAQRRRESEARKVAEEERKRTEIEIDRVRKEVEKGGTDHFESDR